MMTPTKDCAGKAGNTAGSKEQKCLPCDIPAFERNAYYTGKLLTARDLNAEQRYFRDKLRLHYASLHGWGVVCGLKVKPHPYCPKLKILVEEGFAIDSCGREIRVLEEFAASLPPELKKPAHSGGEEHPEHQREGRGREERYGDRDWERGEERGREYREHERGEREERGRGEREERNAASAKSGDVASAKSGNVVSGKSGNVVSGKSGNITSTSITSTNTTNTSTE